MSKLPSTPYSLVSFVARKCKKGELISKDYFEHENFWTRQGPSIVPDYEEVDQENKEVKGRLQYASPFEERRPVYVRLLEDVYFVEIATYGGPMHHVFEYLGEEAFEDVYKELLDLFDSKWTEKTIWVDLLTLWGFDNKTDYWGEYDEWWWFEGVVTNDMLADIAKKMRESNE